MLKTTVLELGGKDAGARITLRELPALVADRHARTILKQLGLDMAGGLFALAMQHTAEVRKLGPSSRLPFVAGTYAHPSPEYDPKRPNAFHVLHDPVPFVPEVHVRDWRNIEVVQQAALLLHVGFLVGREQIEVPVTMQAQQILNDTEGVAVTFCSPVIAAVLEAKMATYHELETVLSLEDAYNIVEVLNVRAVRDYHMRKSDNP